MSDLASDLIFIIIILLGAAVLGILIGYVIGLIQKKKALIDLEKDILDVKADLFNCEKEKKGIELEWANEKENFVRQADILEKELEVCKNELDQFEIKANNKREKTKIRIADLENELSNYQEERDKLQKRTEDLKKALTEVKDETAVKDDKPLNIMKASKAGGAAYNLKLIEGIGPKIEEILKLEGLDTWVKLSMASPDEIRSILIRRGGSAYRVHDPRSWPNQAKLAAAGSWKDLKKYQDKLSGGK